MAAILLALAPAWGLVDTVHRFPETKKKRRMERKRLRKLRQAQFREAARLALGRTREFPYYLTPQYITPVHRLTKTCFLFDDGIAPNRVNPLPRVPTARSRASIDSADDEGLGTFLGVRQRQDTAQSSYAIPQSRDSEGQRRTATHHRESSDTSLPPVALLGLGLDVMPPHDDRSNRAVDHNGA